MTLCAIHEGRVCLYTAMFYRTAVVTRALADSLPKEARFERVTEGAFVAIRFARHLSNGEVAFYFGLAPGAWIGVCAAHGLRDFVL